MTPGGVVTGNPLSEQDLSIGQLTIGPDGNFWSYVEQSGTGAYGIASVTPGGSVTFYPLPANSYANGGMTAADGKLWFPEYTQSGGGRSRTLTYGIDSITTNGSITNYALPSNVSAGSSLVTGPGGNLWFDAGAGRIEELQTVISPTLVQAINAAGSATEDNYDADEDFFGGSTYVTSASVDTTNVADPAPQAVYQSSRYGNSFSYTMVDLTPGNDYTLILQFNEPYFGVGNNGGGVGSRVLNVAINGTQELSDFDIYVTAGGANVALAKDFTATSDAQGNITVQFTSVVNNAIVSGIEVTR